MLLASLTFCCATGWASDSGTDATGEGGLRRDVNVLKADVDGLRRRLTSEVQLETDSYLEDQGIGGHVFTDRTLRPLNEVLRRTVLGGGIIVSHDSWNNVVGGDTADLLSIRLRTNVGFALTSGVEIDTEFQQLIQRGGIFDSSPLDTDHYLPPPVGATGLSPTQVLHPDAPLEVLRAEVRLPSFNLLGRLAHIPVTAVVGRQDLALEDGFVLGDDASGRGMTFDGVRLYAETGTGGRLDVFAGRMAVGASTAMAHLDALADPGSDAALEIAGVSGRMKGLLPDTSLSLYYIRSLSDATPVPPPGYNTVLASEIHTFGVRSETDITTGVSLLIQAATQVGTFGTRDIEGAWAGEAVLSLRTATGGSRGAVGFAHGTGDKTSPGEYEAFTPVAQNPRRWDELGYLTSKNSTIWGCEYEHPASRSVAVGIRLARALAPEPGAPSGLILTGAGPGGGGVIGDFMTLYASFDLYDGEGTTLRLAYTRFAAGRYLPADASDADAFTLSVGASF